MQGAAGPTVDWGSIIVCGCRRDQWLKVLGREVVSRTFVSWNQLDGWLRQVEALRRAA